MIIEGKTGLQVHFTLVLLCRYLQKAKVNGPEGNITFYELAERAIDGPVSEKIKDYVAQVCSLFCRLKINVSVL